MKQVLFILAFLFAAVAPKSNADSPKGNGRYVYVPKKRCPFIQGKESELVKEIQTALGTMLKQCQKLQDRIESLQKQFTSLEPEISRFEHRVDGAASEKGVVPLGSYRGVHGVEPNCSNFARIYRAERDDARLRSQHREKTPVGEDYKVCLEMPPGKRVACINDVYAMKMVATADNCKLTTEELARATFDDKALRTFNEFQSSMLTLLDDDTLRDNCKGDVEALKTQATKAVIELAGSMPGIQPAGALAALGATLSTKVVGRIVDRVRNRFVPNPAEDFKKLQDDNENKSLFCLGLEAEAKSKGCEHSPVEEDEQADGTDFPSQLEPKYTTFYAGQASGASSIKALLSSANRVLQKAKEANSVEPVFNDASGEPAFDQLAAALWGTVTDPTHVDAKTGKPTPENLYLYLSRLGNEMIAKSNGRGEVYWIANKKMGQSLVKLGTAFYKYRVALNQFKKDPNGDEAPLETARTALLESLVSLPPPSKEGGDREAKPRTAKMIPLELALSRGWEITLKDGPQNPYAKYRQWEAKKRLWEELRKDNQVDHDELDNNYTALASQIRPRVASQIEAAAARLKNAFAALEKTEGLGREPSKRRIWYRSNVLPLFRACYLLRGIFYNQGEVQKNEKANQSLADEDSVQRRHFNDGCELVKDCAPPFLGMNLTKFDKEQCERSFLYDQKMAEFEKHFVQSGQICPPTVVAEAPKSKPGLFRRTHPGSLPPPALSVPK